MSSIESSSDLCDEEEEEEEEANGRRVYLSEDSSESSGPRNLARPENMMEGSEVGSSGIFDLEIL